MMKTNLDVDILTNLEHLPDCMRLDISCLLAALQDFRPFTFFKSHPLIGPSLAT